MTDKENNITNETNETPRNFMDPALGFIKGAQMHMQTDDDELKDADGNPIVNVDIVSDIAALLPTLMTITKDFQLDSDFDEFNKKFNERFADGGTQFTTGCGRGGGSGRYGIAQPVKWWWIENIIGGKEGVERSVLDGINPHPTHLFKCPVWLTSWQLCLAGKLCMALKETYEESTRAHEEWAASENPPFLDEERRIKSEYSEDPDVIEQVHSRFTKYFDELNRALGFIKEHINDELLMVFIIMLTHMYELEIHPPKLDVNYLRHLHERQGKLFIG